MNIVKTDINKAVEAVRAGKILVCPTDTVYGLLCDASDKKVLARLYKIKKRSRVKPIPIFVRNIEMAKKLAEISSKQEEYLKKFWPGKVTAVLKKKKGTGTIGLRIPKHGFVISLLRIVNKPLTGTSANVAGKPAPTRINEAVNQFKAKKYRPDLVIDAGDLPKNKPSKVIDLTLWPPKILRS